MVKLLGFFFSIFSELFGGFIFRVKVYLVESEKVIFVKQSYGEGIGVVLDIVNYVNY